MTDHMSNELRRMAGIGRAMILVVILSAWGCTSGQNPRSPELRDTQNAAILEQLDKKIREFVSNSDITFEQFFMELEQKTSTQAQRRAVTLWRVRMTSQRQAALDLGAPLKTLADLWTQNQQIVNYLETGDGRILFGTLQEQALKKAQGTLVEFERIPRAVLPEAEFVAIQKEVRAHAQAYPITGEFVFPSERTPEDPALMSVANRIIDVPLTPFYALNGIGKAPETVRDISSSVDRFRDVVEEFPSNSRWQLKLLATEIEGTPAVTDTVASVKEVAASSTKFTTAFEAMPTKLRMEAEQLLRDINASQPEWRRTLADTQAMVELARSANRDLQETMTAGQKTVADVRAAADALEKAANAVTTTAKEIQKFIPSTMKDENGQITGKSESESAPGGKDKEGFSFQAVTASAEALDRAVQDLQRLLADAANPVGGLAAVDGCVERRVETTTKHLQEVVDHIFFRCLLLLSAVFILLALYRMLSYRWLKNAPPPSSSGTFES